MIIVRISKRLARRWVAKHERDGLDEYKIALFIRVQYELDNYEQTEEGLLLFTLRFQKRGDRPMRAMTAYAMYVDHLLIAEEPLKELEERALAKGEVEVAEQGDTYVLRLPEKLYAFYRLDENGYTVMVSEREPLVLVVAL